MTDATTPEPRTAAADVLADWLHDALDVEFDEANREAFYELTGKIEAQARPAVASELRAALACERTASGIGCRTHQHLWPEEANACNIWIEQARAALASDAGSVPEKQLWRRHGRYGKFDHEPDTADVAYECEDLGEGCRLHKPGQFASDAGSPGGDTPYHLFGTGEAEVTDTNPANAGSEGALDVERLARNWEEVANAHNGSGENGEPCGWCRDRAAQTIEVLAAYDAERQGES